MSTSLQFLQVIQSAGLNVQHIEADGVLKRVPVIGDKHNQKSGAYIFFEDGIPAGGYQNFKTGDWQTWTAKTASTMTAFERQQYKARLEQIKRQREEDELKRYDRKALFAKRIFNKGCKAPHPYPELKRIAMPPLCRVGAFPVWNEEKQKYDWRPDALLVPLYAIHPGTETVFGGWNLQAIFADGEKLFMAGARKRGCCHPIYANSHDWFAPSTILIAEGIATAQTIHMLEKQPTLAALDAGNLIHVAKAAREAWPKADIIIAGDDDHKTEGNPGRTKALEAASEIRGRFVFPEFTEEEKAKGLTDWNDYAISRGLL